MTLGLLNTERKLVGRVTFALTAKSADQGECQLNRLFQRIILQSELNRNTVKPTRQIMSAYLGRTKASVTNCSQTTHHECEY